MLNPNVLVRDHPRVCGEKPVDIVHSVLLQGSPPRMRGKGCKLLLERAQHGITPAYAGKRALSSSPRVALKDHPRVCGEKFIPAPIALVLMGSPPRMRGKA